jgi:DNA-binding CsgD family transcriptional regulator
MDGGSFTALIPIGKRVFETHFVPLHDEGRAGSISCVAFDITERVRAEVELRRLAVGLTAREREILPLLARQGLTAAQIGAVLHIAPSTVRTHIETIAEKFGCDSRRKTVVEEARKRELLDR